MKHYSVSVVCAIGMVILIVSLVILATTSRERNVAEEPLLEITKNNILDKQAEYNRIQKENPGLSEEELLKLPEVLVLLQEDWVHVQGDGIQMFKPMELGLLKIPKAEYPEVSYDTIQLLNGFLRYGTNVEENYAKLIEILPAYLSQNMAIDKDIGGRTIDIFSQFLDWDIVITVLTRKAVQDKQEIRLFIAAAVQSKQSKQDIRVQQIEPMKNQQLLEISTEKDYILLNTIDTLTGESVLHLLSIRNGIFTKTSELRSTHLINVHNTLQDGIVIEINNNKCEFRPNNGIIELLFEGFIIKGDAYD